jgi:hypothetical protein
MASRRRPAPPEALVESALPAGRARAVSEAVLLLLAGFVLDDLRALRIPGFAVVLLLAVVALGFGPVVHARGLAARHAPAGEEIARRRIARARAVSRLGSLVAITLFVVWLVLASGGETLWQR